MVYFTEYSRLYEEYLCRIPSDLKELLGLPVSAQGLLRKSGLVWIFVLLRSVLWHVGFLHGVAALMFPVFIMNFVFALSAFNFFEFYLLFSLFFLLSDRFFVLFFSDFV